MLSYTSHALCKTNILNPKSWRWMIQMIFPFNGVIFRFEVQNVKFHGSNLEMIRHITYPSILL